MATKLKIKTGYGVHPDLSQRAHGRVMRSAMLTVGLKWAVDLLPEHFEKGQQDQFNFAPRTQAWKNRKRRFYLLGLAREPDTDLVFTGRLKSQVLFSARNLIRAFPSRCRVTLTGPSYFTLRPRSKHTKRLSEEVTAMSGRHKRLIEAAADQGFREGLKEARRGGRLRRTVVTTS